MMLVNPALTLKQEIAQLGNASRGRRLQSLGRLPPGTMNKTEAAYSKRLAEMQSLGIVQWWAFEPMTFKIAQDCRLTPDFMVLDVKGHLCAHDVKGSPKIITDDAKVKMKVAAAKMPIRFFYVFPQKGGAWLTQEVGA
jgi:hypothetical protein